MPPVELRCAERTRAPLRPSLKPQLLWWLAAWWLAASGLLACFPVARAPASADAAPFTIAEGLFDASDPRTLGLEQAPGTRTSSVYPAAQGVGQYNHGAVLIAFRGRLYAQWQSSAQDEDAPDTRVLYSSSESGRTWSPAQLLAPARAGAQISNGGWWTDGVTLVAFLNVWPNDLPRRGGHAEFIASTDGERWSSPERLGRADGGWVDGVIEQDLKALPSGRILTAVHRQPGLLVTPAFTDDPSGITGWRFGTLPHLPHGEDMTRELEPSWYRKADGRLVMVFRDQQSSFRSLAAESQDQGETWSLPALTNLPDSRSKQSAGNLPDGAAFLVNNPSGSKDRSPLVLTLSRGGERFTRAYLLRSGSELRPLKYPGRYKRVGYSYPKSIVHDGKVFVSYATNKEDIEVSEVPVSSLALPD